MCYPDILRKDVSVLPLKSTLAGVTLKVFVASGSNHSTGHVTQLEVELGSLNTAIVFSEGHGFMFYCPLYLTGDIVMFSM